jgi:hypothetical protein
MVFMKKFKPFQASSLSFRIFVGNLNVVFLMLLFYLMCVVFETFNLFQEHLTRLLFGFNIFSSLLIWLILVFSAGGMVLGVWELLQRKNGVQAVWGMALNAISLIVVIFFAFPECYKQ